VFVDFPAARSEHAQDERSDSMVGATRSSSVMVPTTLVILVRLPYLAN